jgi:hypothetical protein
MQTKYNKQQKTEKHKQKSICICDLRKWLFQRHCLFVHIKFSCFSPVFPRSPETGESFSCPIAKVSVDVGLGVIVLESDPIVLAEDHVGAKAKVIGKLGIPVGTIFGKSFVEGGEEILEKGAAKKERYALRENGDWRMKCRSETDARETETAYENLHNSPSFSPSSILCFLLSLINVPSPAAFCLFQFV